MKELLLRLTCESCGRVEERRIEPSEVAIFAAILASGFEKGTEFKTKWHNTPEGKVICERCKLVRERIDLIEHKGELEAEIAALGKVIGELP